MKITILNFSFLHPEHIQKLKALGEVVEYDSTKTVEETIERLRGTDVAVADCWEAPLNEEVFNASGDLKYLTLNSTGYEQVDIQTAKEKGVMVANIPNFSTDSVAEQTIALLFAVVRHVPVADRAVRANPFQIDPANRSQDIYLGVNVRDKVLGIIGLGHIGTRVAELAQGLGMTVKAYNRSPKTVPGVEMVDLQTLLKTSDVVSLNSAFSPELKEVINKDTIALMKPGAVLINTARGALVDEKALAEALGTKHVAGYGVDLLADWSLNNPLLKLDNVVFSPHTGFFTKESLKNMADIIVENIESYAAGNPKNVVN